MNDRQLLSALREGHRIHLQWRNYQRKLKRKGKRQVDKVGGVRWHERWMRIYEYAIKRIGGGHGRIKKKARTARPARNRRR